MFRASPSPSWPGGGPVALGIAIAASSCSGSAKSSSYGVTLDRVALGYSIELFVELSLLNQTEEALTRFEQAVLRVPEILECHLMSGEADYPPRRPRRLGL